MPNNLFRCLLLLLATILPAVCSSGWSGSDCKTDVNECNSMPCGYYSSCNNTLGSYSCTCLDGFQGDGRDNCTDINECAGGRSPCDPNAACNNLFGSFDCVCNPVYYGNQTVCYPETMLSTSDASEISDKEVISAPAGVPFLVGHVESPVFRVRRNGLIRFSDDSPADYKLRNPRSFYRQNTPLVAPYWFRWLVDVVNSERWIPTVWYELLKSRTDSAKRNWRAVKGIIENEVKTVFDPLTALIVTWHIRMPTLAYMADNCYWRCRSSRGNETRGWSDLCKQWCDRSRVNGSIEFQAVVVRNATHSYAIFNYGNFRLPVLRFHYTPQNPMNLYAAAGFTDGFSVAKELDFSRRYNNSEQPNMIPGRSGRPGRHVMELSSWYSPISDESRCREWIAEARAKIQVSPAPGCSDCPFDFRTAVLDWRYRPYEFDCSGDSIRMCFRNTSYRCAQSFSGSAASSCTPPDGWSCRFQNCRHLVSTRCCYRIPASAAGSEIRQLCERDMAIWSYRRNLRRILFDRSLGYLISASSKETGYAMYFFKNTSSDGRWWQWFQESPQYLSESYGWRVCSAAGMFSQYSQVRPVCTSHDYRPPAGGFNRGDPHLSTLSNRSYTFNGHCEYHLLTSERSPKSPPLHLQARTAPVRRPDGSRSGATAFVAVALKSGLNDLAVSVLRNDSTNDLDVFASNGTRIGAARQELSARLNATRLQSYRIEAADNASVSIVDESTGVSVTVVMETASLRLGVQLDSQGIYPLGLDGLLGNSYSSGFRLRNGSMLLASSTEKQLFEFGQSWPLTSSDPSYLPYPPGQSRSDFCNASFVPTFAEDFKDDLVSLFGGDVDLMRAADKICASSSSSRLSCMFDAAQLRSLTAAQDAVAAIRDESETRTVLANRPPEFLYAVSFIEVTGNRSYTGAFYARDLDGDRPNVTVLEAVGGTAKLVPDGFSIHFGPKWLLHWQPINNWRADFKLQVIATDSVGAVTVWSPTIRVCDCENGICCRDCDRIDDNVFFHRLRCQCDSGFTGLRCEQKINVCLGNCSVQTTDNKEEKRDPAFKAACLAGFSRSTHFIGYFCTTLLITMYWL